MEMDAGLKALPTVKHLVYTIEKADKIGALRTLLNQRDGEAVIVFGKTKRGVKKAGCTTRRDGLPGRGIAGKS